MDWQLIGYCSSLTFSDPTSLKIPAVRSVLADLSGNRLRRIQRSGRPPNRGGLSVRQTLHLVSDIQKGYNIF
jgi:hypothetical protein